MYKRQEYPVLRKYQRSLIKQIVSISENKGFLFDIDLEFDEFLIRNFYLNNFLIDSWQKLLLNSQKKHSIMYRDFAEQGILRKRKN